MDTRSKVEALQVGDEATFKIDDGEEVHELTAMVTYNGIRSSKYGVEKLLADTSEGMEVVVRPDLSCNIRLDGAHAINGTVVAV